MIFFENLRRTFENVVGGFILRHEEKTKGPSGRFYMVLKDARTGKVLEERRDHNLIVNSASILIARLLKDNKEPSGGITYLAVGTGASGWNLQNPPQPQPIEVMLFNEIARKTFTTQDVTFIDPTTGDPTEVPTNVVDYTCTFAETEAVGPIVEMGLFGGDATDLADSGTQINARNFPVINKTNSMSLTIIFRITS